MSYWYNEFSWWWAHGCPKHVENRNKHTWKRIVRQVGYLQRLMSRILVFSDITLCTIIFYIPAFRMNVVPSKRRVLFTPYTKKYSKKTKFFGKIVPRNAKFGIRSSTDGQIHFNRRPAGMRTRINRMEEKSIKSTNEGNNEKVQNKQ